MTPPVIDACSRLDPALAAGDEGARLWRGVRWGLALAILGFWLPLGAMVLTLLGEPQGSSEVAVVARLTVP
jgi:hypothetical protein